MRTTWLILLLMIVIGAGMYYFSIRKKTPSAMDAVAIINTLDSIHNKTRLFEAFNPTEVHFKDSSWFQNDSTPLNQLSLDSTRNSFDKHYRDATFFLTYDNRYFYDLEVTKPNQDISYDISFQITPVNDTLWVKGTIDDKHNDLIRFEGPMMKMYRSFLLTYNYKLPPPTDSSEVAPSGQRPAKTITVLEN